jgi:hypothetical protein
MWALPSAHDPDFQVKGIAVKLPTQVAPVARVGFCEAPRLRRDGAAVVPATSCLLPDHWCYCPRSNNYACCGNDGVGNPLGCFTNMNHECECNSGFEPPGQTAARGQAYP